MWLVDVDDAVLIAESDNILGMKVTAFMEVCGRRKFGVDAAKSKAMVIEKEGERLPFKK